MRKYIPFVLILLLFSYTICHGTPTPTASRPVSYTTGSTVDADDQNSNENTIYNQYNTHTHEDLAKTSSTTWTIGTNTDVDHDFIVDNGDANNPRLRYDASIDQWAFSNDGTTFKTMIASTDVAVINGAIEGFELIFQASSNVQVRAGSCEINGIFAATTDLTQDFSTASDAAWIGGSSLASASSWVYVYAFDQGSAVASFNFSLTAPDAIDEDSNTGGILKYLTTGGVDYRCIGAVFSDSQKGLTKFFQRNDVIMWDIPVNVTTTLSLQVWSAATSVRMPEISTMGIFGGSATDNTTTTFGLWIRPNGSFFVTNPANAIAYGETGQASGSTDASQSHIATDSLQQIQYQNDVGDSATRIDVHGHILNIR